MRSLLILFLFCSFSIFLGAQKITNDPMFRIIRLRFFKNFSLVLLCLMISIQFLLGQLDSNSRQIEFGAVHYKYNGNSSNHLFMGVNFSTEKLRWKNNVAMSFNTLENDHENFIFSFMTINGGKNYQIHKQRFYGGLGMNAGVFYANSNFYDYTIRFYGINVCSKIEAGFRLNKIVLCTGFFITVGYGYRDLSINDENIVDNFPSYKFSIVGAQNFYVKLILL